MLKKGMRVVEPTKKAGHLPRRGVVVDVDGRTVAVEWEDGHISHLTDAVLVPDKSGSATSGSSR